MISRALDAPAVGAHDTTLWRSFAINHVCVVHVGLTLTDTEREGLRR